MHKFASNIQKLIFSYLLTFDSWSFSLATFWGIRELLFSAPYEYTKARLWSLAQPI